jgi:hypothetical protein
MYKHGSNMAATEPAWASVDLKSLPDEAYARQGRVRSYAHHFVRNGSLYLHRAGLDNAWIAANSTAQADAEVLAHLRRHYSELGVKSAQLQALVPDTNVELLERLLVQHGWLTEADLEPTQQARLQRFLYDLDK